MVSIDKVKSGIAAYLDAELMPKLPTKGWQSIVAGGVISIAISKADSMIDRYKSHPFVEALQIIDPSGQVDVDLLGAKLKEQISKQGCMEIDNVPIVGKLTFHVDDVDKLMQCIKG